MTCTLGTYGVPHVAVEVVVSGQEEPARLGEGHGGDAADDVVVGVDGQLLVSADVVKPAGGVVGPGGKRVAVGEELFLFARGQIM